MKKLTAILLITAIIFTITACSEQADTGSGNLGTPTETTDTTSTRPQIQRDNPNYHPITFNLSEPQLHGDRWETKHFWLDLTDEQLSSVFPGFESFSPISSATAEYNEFGGLYEVRTLLKRQGRENWQAGLTVRLNREVHTESYSTIDFSETLYHYENTYSYTISNVHGIPVVAYYEKAWNNGEYMDNFKFSVLFMVNNVIYNISTSDCNSTIEYNPYLEMLVNEIILADAADLSVLEAPEIPELLSDMLTLAQVYADPDFGMYFPIADSEISEDPLTGSLIWPDCFDSPGLTLRRAHRWINQHTNQLDTSWYDGGFERSLDWKVIRPIDLHYTSTQIHTHRVGELTFDIIESYANYSGEDMGGWFISNLFFFVNDDIVIELRSMGLTAEEVWSFIEPIL
jgi:hypothetical protein